MNVTRYQPFTNFPHSRTFFDSMFADELVRGYVVRPARENEASAVNTAVLRPHVDVSEQPSAYEVHADLPGVSKEDIAVTVDGDVLTIAAETKPAGPNNVGEQPVYSERAARKWSRSFRLGNEIDFARAQAKYENGVLALTLPKKVAESVQRLTIQ